MQFTPKEYGYLIDQFIQTHERGNVLADMGMGKTGQLIYSFSKLQMFGEAKRMLVLGPKRVCASSWPGEIRKFKESFGHLSIAAAVGPLEDRLAAVRSTPDILCVNYDHAEWLTGLYGIDHWPFDMVAADESPRLKSLRMSMQRNAPGSDKWHLRGQGGKRSKALSYIAFTKVRRWYNMTGTVIPNGLLDMWGQQWFVDMGRALGNSFTDYKNRWFYYPPTQAEFKKEIPHAYAMAEIQAKIKPSTIVIRAKDYFDLTKPIEKIMYIDLPTAARKAYREMEREFITWLEVHPEERERLEAALRGEIELEAVNAGALMQKCLQIASGAVIYQRGGQWVKVHDEKIEMLKSICAETNGTPLLIAYQYRADVERILKEFPRFRFLDDKPKTIDAWNAGQIPGLILHPASGGHGLSLQDGGYTLVDFSTGFNLELDQQVLERIGPMRQLQSGRPDQPVYRYRIIARNTFEETRALPAVRSKADNQELFVDGLR